MEISQVYKIVNDATSELLGDSVVLNEDLSNIVDVGNEIFNAASVDKYVKSLVDHIGRVIFVNRKYAGSAPSVLMDGWQYGAVMEKIQSEMPEATENESWELEDGVSYDVNVFTKPKASAKFYNKRTTFEIPMSFTERQVRGSFSSAEQVNGFLSMITTNIENSATVKTDSLIMRTINNFIGETFYDYDPTGAYTTYGSNRCINLLKLYNDRYSQTLTAANCLQDPDFIRFAAFKMNLVRSRIRKMSTLFNIGRKQRFTPEDRLHFIALADFYEGANIFLQSATFHNEFVALPNAETVPYWQGSGQRYEFNSITSINVTTADNHTVNPTGILGVMFDRDALGVCNVDRRVTTNYNAKAEFYNNWYKFDAGYFNDYNENFIVFYAAS